jgi:predicted ATPase
VNALPSGTVTFLFTDVEGSTRLLQELGDEYADVLAEHRRVLRDAFARHGGVEVDTQGDAFFVAFLRASDALRAAREATDALDEPVRVRIGVHTGEPLVTEEGYVGIDVHRAARIAAAGHGGQILVSQSTRDLVGGDGLRDLGEHRLKDLTAPERIYQLGDADFPPLKSLDHTNLPIAASALVGRQLELRELVDLLSDGARLVTVTGPGGSGKTRLALQAAGELAGLYDDVWFVPLASLDDPELVIPTTAQTIGAPGALVEALGAKRTLLVLDNFEHLLDASTKVSELLSAAESLRVLVTSRSPLRVDGEREMALDSLGETDAAALFVERARAIGRRYEIDDAVIAVCRRVDRLPLAIELAAARTKLLDPPVLLEHLDERLLLLTGGRRDAPERQRTLRSTIAWSYGLLDPEHQAAFRRLAVFANGFSLEAAETVADASMDDLATLVDASLLKPLGTGRFLILETIREYALTCLRESDESAWLRARHAAYFRDLAEQAEPALETGGPDQVAWLQRLEDERDNLRLALAHFRETGDTGQELRLAAASYDFWWLHGYVREARRYLDHALSAGVPRSTDGITALEAAAYLAYLDHDETEAARWASTLVELAASLDDDVGSARGLHMTALVTADTEERERLEKRALKLLGTDPYARYVHEALGLIACERGDLETARGHLEQSLEISRSIDESTSISGTLLIFAYVALSEGDDREAVVQLREAVVLARQVGDVTSIFWPRCWAIVAGVLAKRGSPGRAAEVLGAAQGVREQAGADPLSGYTLRFHEEVAETIRSLLPAGEFEAAWERGRQEGTEELLEQALSDLD